MRLKMLEIQGFKSFPDKTKLTFDQGITAVIGPNGSGKSNISDSIRWVLGEQSNKQLRGQKMEDVIFGGTKLRRPLGFAEVTIVMDNTDRALGFDEDEVAVTRRYYRSGESEYKINGASVRLKDVRELFMDTGLGRDGYSMIGQGRIDEIVGSKSDERRVIFEEAAGISRFRYRKAEAERKLERAEENMLRLRDIADELESRVGPLKEQSEKAAEFLEISVEKKDLEIGLWLNTVEKSKEELREHDNKLTIAKAQYEKLERDLANLEASEAINARDIQSIAVQIDAIRRSSSEADERSSQTKSEIAVLENTIMHNNDTVSRLERDIENDLGDADIARGIEEKTAQIEELTRLIGVKQREYDEKCEQLGSLGDNSGDYSQQIEEKNRILNGLSAEISENRVKMITAKESAEELIHRAESFESDREALETNIAAADKELSELERDLAHCEQQIAECRNVTAGFEMKEKSRSGKLDQLRAECDQLRLDVGETERRIKILQDLERSMEGFSYAVKSVSKEAERGSLRGIHGPVSRLIGVPAKYAAAIEVALGAAAQNIIVDSEEDAKRAIAFLKRTNGGRATFLPIGTIRPNLLKENGVENCGGFVGIASELVTYKAEYQNIISSLLGRTAIAEDIDSAAALAKRFSYRFRVVTLDGQVVNAGGSLTGGSLSKNSGVLSRGAQIEKLKSKLGELSGLFEKRSAEVKTLSEEVAKMRADMQAAASELATASEDKIRVEGEIRLLTEQRKTAAAGLQTLERQNSESAARRALYEKAAADAEEEIARIEFRIAEIDKDLKSLSGGRDMLAARREQLAEETGAIKLEIIGYTKDIENCRSSIEQFGAAQSDKAAHADLLRAEIADIADKNAQIEKQIAELRLLEDGLIKANVDARGEIERLSRRREELEKASYQSRAAEREKLDEREKLSGEIARLGERRRVMEEEYNDIVSKLFDEYELTLSAAAEIAVVPDDIPAANKRLAELRRRIRALGSVNVAAIEEYKEVSERYEFMRAQLDDVEKSRRELTRLIGELTDTMKDMFTSQFEIIAKNFTEVFKELFGGGTAELRLTDPENVLETGIDIVAQPPGKNIAIIEQLSGGEKALIAVSIYFAIMKVNPPPFCLLDEVEAALDEVNVDRFAAYLRRMSGGTQFIVITHRRGTMEEADVLYGVTMQEKGVSKLLSINVSQIEKTLESRVEK